MISKMIQREISYVNFEVSGNKVLYMTVAVLPDQMNDLITLNEFFR